MRLLSLAACAPGDDANAPPPQQLALEAPAGSVGIAQATRTFPGHVDVGMAHVHAM